MKKFLLYSLLTVLIFSCKSDPKTTPVADKPKPTKTIKVPRFVADSAYNYISKQVDFGPREPNSDGHQKCQFWLVEELKKYCDEITEQRFDAKGVNNEDYKGVNIIGSINPNNKERIILAAHWDTRYIADADKDEAKAKTASVQADDGGSGVGVLLEIARLLKENPIDLGVDIILFDLEDQGISGGGEAGIATWGLGAQYWSKNFHVSNYEAKYGILLDMVGAEGATFNKENVTGVFQPAHVRKVHDLYKRVWDLAKKMGRGNMFVNKTFSGTIDDHFFVNLHAGIPMIDIINKNADGFGDHWHTHDDNMDVISKRTLSTVGQVVLSVVYNEEMGKF